MSALRIGSLGPEVESLQLWLAGHYPDVMVDGAFGPVTDAVVKRAQHDAGVKPDGVVGEKTRIAFARLGWTPEGVSEPLPPRPNFSDLNFAGRQRVFGEIQAVPLDDGSGNVMVTNAWNRLHLTRVAVPQLIGVHGAPRDGVIFWHRSGVDRLLGFWADVEREGLLDRVQTWAGSWAPRFVRGSRTTLSSHAHATAFDINAQWNQLGAQPAPKGHKGSVVELVPLANRWKFFWGGHFAGRLDGMHFALTAPD